MVDRRAQLRRRGRSLRFKGGMVDGLAALVNDRRTTARGSGDMILSGVRPFPAGKTRTRARPLHAQPHGRGGDRGETSVGRDTVRVTTFGARVRRGLATGLSASAEAAYQTGHRGPDDHRAFAWRRSRATRSRLATAHAAARGGRRDGDADAKEASPVSSTTSSTRTMATTATSTCWGCGTWRPCVPPPLSPARRPYAIRGRHRCGCARPRAPGRTMRRGSRAGPKRP